MSARWPELPGPLDTEGLDVDRSVRRDVPRDVVHRPVVGDLAGPARTAGYRARAASARAGRTVGFYAARAPLGACKLALRAPVGAWRLTWAGVLWVSDDEGRRVRRTLSAARPDAGTPEASQYVRVCAEHRATQWLRLRVTAGAFVVLTILILWLLPAPEGPGAYVVGAVALLALGWFGRDEERPVIASHVTAASGPPALSSSLVVDALGSLGIGELNKALREDDRAVRFVAPIARDGQGWRVDLDLPGGVTAGDVVERRDRLASGLRRPEGCVWPEPDADGHAGRLVIWVGDKPMSLASPVVWPLTRTGRANVFEPVPFGVDQRGRPVTLTLAFASMVIGAVPRQGKTAALRVLLLAAALDPRAELHVANLKGGGDLDPLAPVAHFIVAGDEPEDIDALLADLRAVQADMRRRYKTMRDLPREVCPDAKVTDDLAGRRGLGLHPVVVGIDECQVMFEHPKHGKDFDALVTDLVKRGPAVGISVIVATQRPDAKSLPSGIRANAILRFCLRVTSQVECDMVLGTSAYKSGLRPTMFTRRDLGVGYLVGDGDDPVIVRAAYVDTPTADVIAARARAEREHRGMLTGAAAGDEPELTPAPGILDDVAAIWPEGRARAGYDELADLLADAGHDTTPEAVSAALRGVGVPSVQVNRRINGKATNTRGAARRDIDQARADR